MNYKALHLFEHVFLLSYTKNYQ